jgi:hypothetical protein
MFTMTTTLHPLNKRWLFVQPPNNDSALASPGSYKHNSIGQTSWALKLHHQQHVYACLRMLHHPAAQQQNHHPHRGALLNPKPYTSHSVRKTVSYNLPAVTHTVLE